MHWAVDQTCLEQEGEAGVSVGDVARYPAALRLHQLFYHPAKRGEGLVDGAGFPETVPGSTTGFIALAACSSPRSH